MKIINTIYSSHLTNDSIPEADLRAAATRRGDVESEIIRGLYPEAEIETIIKHGVYGVGSGVRVLDEDADLVAERISNVIAAKFDYISDKTWA